MPILVKRYPNRKLYDTVARRYISLSILASYLHQGEDVQVIDHATGEDLTTATLAQIIVGQEKRRRGLSPGHFLAGLFHAGEITVDRFRELFAWSASVDDEIRRRVDALVQQGEFSSEEAERLLEKLLLTEERSGLPGMEEIVERILSERGIPTRQEILALNEQIDDLMQQLGE